MKLLKKLLLVSGVIALATGCSSDPAPVETPAPSSVDNSINNNTIANAESAPSNDVAEPATNVEPIKLTFWHSMGGAGGTALEQLVADYNASQNEIIVTAQYQGTYDDAVNKLKSSAISNSGPDIMQLYDIGTRWMIDSGYAVAIEDLINQAGYDLSQIDPSVLGYYTVNDKLYGMPFNTSTPILYYNKDAFAEAGLTEADVPTTFEEILEVSEILTKKNGNEIERYGFAMHVYGWFFEQFLVKQDLFYANNGNGRAAHATAVEFDENGGGVAILQGWKDLYDSGFVGSFGREWATTRDAFTSGRIAMTLGSTASLGDIELAATFDVGTGYFPKVHADDPGGVSIGGAAMWIMNKDEQTEQAAWKFTEYMISPEVQAEWAKATGYFPVSLGAYELATMQDHLEQYPAFQTAIDQLRDSNGSTGALLAVFSEARATIEENIEKVLNNTLTPEEAVSDAAKVINNAIERYNLANGIE
ncbi:MAG: ABC transporter substrate-binding protein [Epulopiscium sp. Nele67-Bin002]|nr:MAG: ABC transporter substrate-binding protein [Epulopiscium sp. Nele67-Bin002]OON91957.1 MAG: ABC transporter substrate-binding protein [Epulopiscium sp. Nele67-Bin001]